MITIVNGIDRGILRDGDDPGRRDGRGIGQDRIEEVWIAGNAFRRRPTIVAACDDTIDLVVVPRAILCLPQVSGVTMETKTEAVAMPKAEKFLRVGIRIRDEWIIRRCAAIWIQPENLAVQRRQSLACGAVIPIAGADVEVFDETEWAIVERDAED